MKTNEQQNQTREFFERFAKQWSENAKSDRSDFVNIIQIRNNYVTNVCKRFLTDNAKTLDVGCGTGDLVIKLLKMNYDSTGIDFSNSMINEARHEASKQKVNPEKFLHVSFFDYHPKSKFDLISANGFIEYISESELEIFLNRSHDSLNKNGLLVFESRNRLFNCFSFNNYTEAEIEIQEINHLLEECFLFNKNISKDSILKRNFDPKLSRNLTHHELTDTKYATITVDVRYQYTPFQLINKLKQRGFDILDLYPAHPHAIATGAKERRPELHKQLSYYLLDQQDIHMQLLPQSSSFMILAKLR